MSHRKKPQPAIGPEEKPIHPKVVKVKTHTKFKEEVHQGTSYLK